jgi:hypothetical protein
MDDLCRDVKDDGEGSRQQEQEPDQSGRNAGDVVL